MQETWVWPLGQEDALEKEMATYSSILAWRIPQREEPSGLQNPGAQSSSVQLLKPAHYNRESPCTTTKSQHCLKKKKKKKKKERKNCMAGVLIQVSYSRDFLSQTSLSPYVLPHVLWPFSKEHRYICTHQELGERLETNFSHPQKALTLPTPLSHISSL